jgi:glutaredoxin-like YruB-family protein
MKPMKVHAAFVIFFVLTLTIGTPSAEIYKWVDENGITHYSDSQNQNISEAGEVQELPSIEQNPQDSTPSPPQTQDAKLDANFFDILDESKEESEAVAKPSVEIYETEWCGYCKKAKKFFRSRGIDFVAYDIEKDPEAARRMRSMTSRNAVPLVVINGQPIQGYSEAAYAQALQN